MTTITILLLLVAAASTIAFSPPAVFGPETGDRVVMDDFGQPRFLIRRRRDISAASKSGAGAGSFASSGSGSTSGSFPGYAGFGARSGFDGAQGYNGVNPGGIAFPGANDYGFGAQNPYNQYGGAGYVPVDFNALFQQYIAFMQRLAQQQAYAAKGYGNQVSGPYYYAWTAGETSSSPSSAVAASVTSAPYYYKAAGYYHTPSSSALYYNEPVSTNQYSNKLVPWTMYDKTPTYTTQYFSTPASAAQNYGTPTATAQYYSTPTTTAQYYSTPTSSAQHFSTIFHSRASSGVPVRQQYSHSRTQIAFKPFNSTRYYTPDSFVNNYDNTVPGGYNDSPLPDFSDINSRAGFADYGGASGFAFPGATNFGGQFGGSPSDGSPVSASASASLGPRGGFGSASISPPPQGNPELGTRMGSLPPSNGDNFSVFTSSSSSSSDLDGMKKSSKEATSVINDNGKVSTYHVRDP